MNSSRQSVMDSCEKVLNLAENKVELYLAGKSGEKFGTTQLSKDCASEANVSFSFAFALISAYINGREDIESKRGPKGGIKLKKEDK